MTEYITKEQALEAVRGKMWPGEIEAAIKAIPGESLDELLKALDEFVRADAHVLSGMYGGK